LMVHFQARAGRNHISEDVEALDVLVVLFGGEHDVEGELVRPAVLASDDPGEVREEDRLAGA
jgi:hypothetical protein